MGMKILIPGGAGFIGSNFVYYMQANHPDYDLTVVDALTYAGNLETLERAMANPRFKFVKSRHCRQGFVYKIFEEEKPDIVVNFAAESHVDRSIENPGLFLQTNVIGTGVLLDASLKYGARKISSDIDG